MQLNCLQNLSIHLYSVLLTHKKRQQTVDTLKRWHRRSTSRRKLSRSI